LGIYEDGGSDSPTILKVDAGTVSCTASAIVYSITINQTLTAGWWWLAANSQTAATTNTYYFTSGSSAQAGYGTPATLNAAFAAGFSEASVTGAFANTTTTNRSNGMHMSMRVA
jgi:hypothetical protein